MFQTRAATPPRPDRRRRRAHATAAILRLGLVIALVATPLASLAGAAVGTPPVPLVLAQRGFELDAGPPLPRAVRERDPAQWEETDEIVLPPWPRPEDLVTVPVDGDDGRFTYRIDTRSLRTGADGVVRYTLVAEAPGGARNVSYEGLRCTPNGVYRVYAYGSDGGFTPTAIAEDWLPIERMGSDRLRYDLWQHFLCVPRLFQPRPRDEQLRVLRTGRVPHVETRGFLSN